MIRSVSSKWAALLVSTALCVFLANCQGAKKTYVLTGQVISKQPVTQQLIIDNDDIPGFMPAMTMPYLVRDPEGLMKVQPGDVIQADVVVAPGNKFWLEHVAVTGKGAARSPGNSTARHVLRIGEKVPDVPMVNQDGRTIRFSQFQGKTVLLTFIYTRCPFPDYCPLLSGQFSTIQRDLAMNPHEYKDTHLISISLDPNFDKPPILREYGLRYMGHDPKGFQHWDFVSTTPEDLEKLTASFGLAYSQQDAQISHSMNTVLLARDGTVAQMWPGNDWQTAEVLDVTRHALAFKN